MTFDLWPKFQKSLVISQMSIVSPMPDFSNQPETARPQEIEALIKATPEAKDAIESRPAPAEAPRETPQAAPVAQASHVVPIEERVATPATKSERLHGIEKVMTSGLEEIYSSLDPRTKAIVKTEGEKTASQIEQLLERGQAAAKKILHLIRSWLQKIPGVNKFFLEQESKIKTDKIMAMNKRENNF